MWSRRNQPEEPTSPVRPSSPSPVHDGMPLQTTSVRQEAEPLSTRVATIGKGVTITGQIFSKEDLVIDGEVEGTVEAHDHRLTIGPNGKVKAGIKAKDVVVLGHVQGNVEAADKMEIRKDAKLVGDIKTARISIEDGAVFKGSIDIIRTEAKAAPKAAPQSSSQANPVPIQQTMAAGNNS
ncbi:MAG: polymer-forming cytoskeletal protein [Bryobacter sp.]|nr:polymer-forming cytoskeletal protein [Bryobacter sp.]